MVLKTVTQQAQVCTSTFDCDTSRREHLKMRLARAFGTLSLLAYPGAAFAQIVGEPNTTLAFHVASGENDNYFLRDGRTSAQLVLTSANSTSAARRLVVALPAGNSGALAYFLPKDASADAGSSGGNSTSSTTLGVTLVEGSFKSTTADYFNVGVQADLVFDQNATLGVTIIGAVRAMRGTHSLSG